MRLFRFPLIILIVFGSIFASPFVCVALDFRSEEIMPYFFMMAIYMGPLLASFLIIVWWLFFFRAVRWPARLGILAGVVIALGAGVVSAGVFAIRQVEFTMSPVGLVPRFHFVWDVRAEDKLAQKLAADSTKPGDASTIDATVGPYDFPAYRGRNTDGVVTFAKLKTDWDKNPPTVLWRNPCPGGYSGVAVAGNIVVTLQQHDDKKQEAVVCYDRATGKHRWFYHYDAYYIDKNLMGNGPRSTPTIHDNHIYSIGATGELICLTVEGKKKWSHNILDLAKAKNMKWGLTGSPLIVGDLVIAHAGIDANAPSDSALIAFEQASGKIRWQVGRRPAGYSSPQLVTLANTPQILLFDGAGLVSYDPKTGKELWQHPWVTQYEMNSIQPVVVGSDRVFISSELDNGAALLHVKAPANDKNAWSAEVVWKNKKLAARLRQSGKRRQVPFRPAQFGRRSDLPERQRRHGPVEGRTLRSRTITSDRRRPSGCHRAIKVTSCCTKRAARPTNWQRARFSRKETRPGTRRPWRGTSCSFAIRWRSCASSCRPGNGQRTPRGEGTPEPLGFGVTSSQDLPRIHQVVDRAFGKNEFSSEPRTERTRGVSACLSLTPRVRSVARLGNRILTFRAHLLLFSSPSPFIAFFQPSPLLTMTSGVNELSGD